MFANIFGDYLVKNGKITKEQFVYVMEEQKKTRVKLGLIAVSEKMITDKQADEINRKQAVMDKRFGDIAVELGYLRPEQVTKLLSLQGNPYMVFIQTITDKGYMLLKDLEDALISFQQENNFSDADIEAIKSGDVDRIIPVYLPEVPALTKELILVAVRTINRLISTDISIQKAEFVSSYSANAIAMQHMKGDCNVTTGFSGNQYGLAGMLAIANTYAGEEFDKLELDALDSISEFINIINGLFATSLSYQRVETELLPPVFAENVVTLNGEKQFCVVPLTIMGNAVSLIVSTEEILQF